MANPEHLAKLNEGMGAWKGWRSDHPHTVPDLSGADLRGSNLRKAYLEDAVLRGACLAGANLIEADLGGANLDGALLFGANLSGAYLLGAHLEGARFGREDPSQPEGTTTPEAAKLCEARLEEATLLRADLEGVDLRRANLEGANLRWAQLAGADLSEANLRFANLAMADLADSRLDGALMGYTIFGDNDLSAVRLDGIQHWGPSTIGIDTICRSQGKIPETFLREGGVPDDFIAYVHALVARPIEFYSCFISHSSKDGEFVRRLHAVLQQAGVRCWFAPEDLKIGDKFRTRIDESIRLYDKLLLILTKNSIPSPWVEEEVEAALEKERKQSGKLVLFPIRLDDAVMEADQAWAASLRRTRHIGDFRNWKDHDAFKNSFDRLLRDLKNG